MAKKAIENNEEIQAIISTVEKQFGKGALFILGSQASTEIEVISTGSIRIDRALGVGGLPRGRTAEIYGPNGAGKTTLALQTIAEAQKLGHMCAFVDAEHALDIKYAQSLGVDLEKLLISQPDNGEQALEITDTLCRSDKVAVIVVDSVSALVPQVEIEGGMGDAHVGLQARLMSQAMRKLTASVQRSKTVLIFLNQTRMKIGTYGNPLTTSGGEALKFYASIRMEVNSVNPKIEIKDDETNETKIIGGTMRVKVVKNKVAPPFQTTDTIMIYGKGIDKAREIAEELLSLGLASKAGAWIEVETPTGEREKLQGMNAFSSYISEHLDFFKEKVKNAWEEKATG